MPATGSVLGSNAPAEQRINNKKRKLAVSAISANIEDSQARDLEDSDGSGRQNTAFPTQESIASPLVSPQLEREPQNVSSSESGHEDQERQRHRDSLFVLNTATTHSTQVERATDDEASDETDEAEMQGMSRMLDDGKGRMREFLFYQIVGSHYLLLLSYATVYIGDSAPLSYLQTIRQLVGSVVGTSMFTVDPHRHNILEASMQAQPVTFQYAYTLPDREAALYLVESFFANVSCL